MKDGMVSNALDDARLMIDYAVRKGLDAGRDNLEIITSALRVQDALSPETEARVWAAASDLAQRIRPATIDSLRALKSPILEFELLGRRVRLRWFSMAQRSVFYYTSLALSCIAFLLVFQTYSYIGINVLKDIERLNAEKAGIESELKRLDESTPVNNAEMKKKVEKIEDIQAKKTNVETSIASRFVMISIWNNALERVADLRPYADANAAGTKAAEEGAPPSVVINDRTATDLLIFVINVLNTYILPFVFGLLGVCAYILRDMSSAFKTDSFVSRKKVLYRLRLALGSLAGVTLGYMLKTGYEDAFFETLTPMGMAFVLGYSIELFFTMMDEIIRRLTGKGAPAEPAAPGLIQSSGGEAGQDVRA